MAGLFGGGGGSTQTKNDAARADLKGKPVSVVNQGGQKKTVIGGAKPANPASTIMGETVKMPSSPQLKRPSMVGDYASQSEEMKRLKASRRNVLGGGGM